MGDKEDCEKKIVDKAKSLGYYVEANSELLSYSEMVGLAIKTMLGVLMVSDEGRENIYRESFLQYVSKEEDEEYDDKEAPGFHATD